MVDTQSGNSLNWLAETKFQPPLLREDVIIRRHLIDDLRNGLVSHPLTLLSAPAGYGKTTLLATLQQTFPKLHMSWLSLDEEDNDPVRFMMALIIALQHLNPSCGTVTQSLLTSDPNLTDEVRRVTSVLINDVLETLFNPFTLVLDDLHRINEPVIYAALDYLLEHVPPQMHLVVATRVDPPLSLARLRARGKVAEYRLGELRFSNEETSTFLNDHLHLGLSDAELSYLQTHTEGWVAGLRLLASSLDRSGSVEDRKTFIRQFAETNLNIFEFLAEEVFNRQEVQVKDFLLKTAVLPELTPTLCKAVTQRADAGKMLEDMYHHNLFMVQVPYIQENRSAEDSNSRFDGRGPAPNHTKSELHYRFHDLFAEFLQHKLEEEMPELAPELHLKAAMAESDPSRAVGHLLAAEKWQEAVKIIEQIGSEVFMRGYLDSLSRWINALPASIRERHPRLLHYLSNCAFWKGDWKEMQMLLERALKGFEAAVDEPGQGEVLVDLASCNAALGEIERSGELYGRALSYPIPPHTRVQALLGHALAKGAWGDYLQTELDFNAAMALLQQSEELDQLHLVTLYFFDPSFAFLPGGLEHLERIAHQARFQLGDEISPARLIAEEMTTAFRLFRGQFLAAIRSGEGALTLRKRLGGQGDLSMNAALSLLIAHAARGDFTAVEPLFDDLFQDIIQTDKPPPELPIYLFYAGRVRWLQGCLQEAREIYAQMCSFLEEDPQREFPEAFICRVWMESLLEMAEGHYTRAESLLLQPEVLEQSDRASSIHGSTRLMLARLYWNQNRLPEALMELESVLPYHEKLGVPFAILVEGQSILPLLHLAVDKGVQERYAAHLLGLLGADVKSEPVYLHDTGAILTPREVEVLKHIVEGESNRIIAERLVITESTVKTHISHIFAKMEVSSRGEAAARSRELRLL